MMHFADVVDEVWTSPKTVENVRNITEIWKDLQERKVNEHIIERRDNESMIDVDAKKEIAQLVSCKVSFDHLANEWITQQKLPTESRLYLLEKLIPTLVVGVESLLTKAASLDLIGSQDPDPLFNPINFLAQFLMRNNPKYDNRPETSAYIKTIKDLLLKQKETETAAANFRLSQMKEEVRKRRAEQERIDRFKFWAKGRPEALEALFVEWAGDRTAVVSLSLVQSALRSFKECADDKERKLYALELQPTDISGHLINIREFVEFTGKHIASMNDDTFREFLHHISRLSTEYRKSIELDALRNVIANLFIGCDYGQTGHLDRQRVLQLLEMFYDESIDVIKSSLIDPRKWPVVEIEEEEDEIERFIVDNHLDSDAPLSPVTSDTEIMQSDNPSDESQNDTTPKASFLNTKTQNANMKTVAKTKARPKQNAMDAVMQISFVSPESVANDNKSLSNYSRKSSRKIDCIDDEGNVHYATSGVDLETEVKLIMEPLTSSAESIVLSHPVISTITTPTAFDNSTLNQNQFVNLLVTFLGDAPINSAIENLVRFIRTGYMETEDERNLRIEKTRKDTLEIRRQTQIGQLFDMWDGDGSGYLEINEIETVLSKWREESIHEHLFNETWDIFEDVFSKITRKSFAHMINKICSLFPNEDVFDPLMQFLSESVQRSFEERKRGDFRKKWLQAIDFSGRTSGGLLDPVYKATFLVIEQDAEKHGKNKRLSSYVARLENNDGRNPGYKGDKILRYVSCTVNDTDLVLNKVLHRGMKCISFSAIDNGKPILVAKVLNHKGVYLWNPSRREDKIEGSYICLPLKDHEKCAIGLLGIDTLADPHDKATFLPHEISFYQGVAKALSQALQFVDMRQKTMKISESAVTWILRRSRHVHEVVLYLVEPSLKPNEGSVLRKMAAFGHNHCVKPEIPPRLERKDNLFRDYLFKCIDSSETLTADAYGERHFAYPLRDSEGLVVSIVDISIGRLRSLGAHEMKEIQRMLKLLGVAHKEMSSEVAGENKNIVLEVEKQHEGQRIDVLFDRIMLQDLRANVGRLDSRAFAEIKSYKDPPKIIHDILKAVLGIYFWGPEDEETESKLEEWTSCKQLVNNDLVRWITTFDPTASLTKSSAGDKLAAYLSEVRPGAVAKEGSLPAQYLFNWAFVCLSLIEHSNKMHEHRNLKNQLLENNNAHAQSENHDGRSVQA